MARDIEDVRKVYADDGIMVGVDEALKEVLIANKKKPYLRAFP